MSCVSCLSTNEKNFPAEINIHFPGIEGLDKPTVWAFPRLTVCLDCGLVQFKIEDIQLRQLANSDSRLQSRAIAA